MLSSLTVQRRAYCTPGAQAPKSQSTSSKAAVREVNIPLESALPPGAPWPPSAAVSVSTGCGWTDSSLGISTAVAGTGLDLC